MSSVVRVLTGSCTRDENRCQHQWYRHSSLHLDRKLVNPFSVEPMVEEEIWALEQTTMSWRGFCAFFSTMNYSRVCRQLFRVWLVREIRGNHDVSAALTRLLKLSVSAAWLPAARDSPTLESWFVVANPWWPTWLCWSHCVVISSTRLGLLCMPRMLQHGSYMPLIVCIRIWRKSGPSSHT